MSEYVSSIITKYGDTEKVKDDAKILQDIINRQGTSLLIDRIAEHVGTVSLKYDIDSHEVRNLVDSLVLELREALLERT